MRSRPHLPGLALALLLAGCHPGDTSNPTPTGPHAGLEAERATLTTDRQSYEPGSDIELLLSNRGVEPIGYNGCQASRERFSEGVWRPYELLRLCTAALYPLPAATSAAFTERVTEEWEPGSYRIVLPVYIGHDAGVRSVLTTAVFEVRG